MVRIRQSNLQSPPENDRRQVGLRVVICTMIFSPVYLPVSADCASAECCTNDHRPVEKRFGI